ncbi:MAG: iron ABC transporter permease [Propionibacteriaceae bacterium]|nr:iron ABC transporter permease [Propionibacteriaceae bacterium]
MPSSPAPARDSLGFTARRTRTLAWTAGLALILGLVIAAGIGIGPVGIAPGDILAVFAHQLFGAHLPDGTPGLHTIVWDIRTPRVLLGVSVGAGLALAGVMLQSMVRNVLADPYGLGISSGASLGTAAALLFGVGVGLGNYALQGSAFIGALGAALLVVAIARAAGRLTPVRVLLAGVAVGYALSAATSFLVFASDSAEGARSIMFWLLGSLGLANWNGALLVIIATVALALIALVLGGRHLDALAVGDDTALTLGIDPDRLRLLLLVGSCLLVGVIVAMSGAIGFVGLVVPHLARRLVGAAHRAAAPVAALLGAILLVCADIAARTLLAPQEIPIGIITALVGAPFLLVLVRRMHA